MCRLLASLVLAFCLVSATVPSIASAQSDPEDLGIVSDSEWESPQFGTSVSWSESWEPQLDGSTRSNIEDEIDGVELLGDHGSFILNVLKIRQETLESHRDFLIGSRKDLNKDADFSLVESGENDNTAYFAYTASQGDKQFTDLIEVYYLADELIGVSELLGWTFNLPTLFDEIQAGVAVDGETPFGYYYTSDTIPVDPDAVDPDATEVTWVDDIPGLIEESTYQSPQFNVPVTWDDPWTINPDTTSSDAESAVDYLVLGSKDSDLFLSWFTSAEETPSDYLERGFEQIGEDANFDNAEIVDQGESGAIAYLAVSAEQGGNAALLIFEATWIDEDASIMQANELVAWTADMQAEFDNAQSWVVVGDDEPFGYFPSEALIDAIGFELVDTEPTETTESEPDASAPQPTRPDDQEKNSDKEPEATEEDKGTSGDVDESDTGNQLPGIVGTGEYASPIYGYEVTWTDDWSPVDAFVTSDATTGADFFRLANGDNFFQVSTTAVANESIESYLGRLITFRSSGSETDMITNVSQQQDGDRILLSYTWVNAQDMQYTVYIEAWLLESDPNVVLMTEVFANNDEFGDAYETVQNDIELDGELPFSSDEILDEVA